MLCCLYYKKLENILNVHQSEIRFWHFGPSEEAYMTRVYEDERLSQYSFKKQLYWDMIHPFKVNNSVVCSLFTVCGIIVSMQYHSFFITPKRNSLAVTSHFLLPVAPELINLPSVFIESSILEISYKWDHIVHTFKIKMRNFFSPLVKWRKRNRGETKGIVESEIACFQHKRVIFERFF